jgi:hypothetical protein
MGKMGYIARLKQQENFLVCFEDMLSNIMFLSPRGGGCFVMAGFTHIQIDDAILGPIPTFLNMGPCTHYFIAICR